MPNAINLDEFLEAAKLTEIFKEKTTTKAKRNALTI
jgi:hypothetical protein